MLIGSTGPIHSNEYGKRKGIELEILNLRYNSFQKVSNDFLNFLPLKHSATVDYIYQPRI